MKILFSADWHIKLGQKGVPIPWQKNRFNLLFKDIVEVFKTTKCDQLIIGGDIFDRLPNMEELELYFEFLREINDNRITTIIYPGNHEAVKKNTSFLTNLKNITYISTSGYATIIDDYFSTDDYDIIPYNRLKQYVENPVDMGTKILFTHVRGEIPPHVLPEVPLELFDKWDTVFAGDLHSKDNCQRNIVYPGSPITTSFHRNQVESGVIVLDTEDGSYDFIELELPQLIRRTVTSKHDMVPTDFHHTIYELEGDAADMSIQVDNELLDKKIVKKENRSSLNLTANMTISDELGVYLTEVMKLPADKVGKIKSIFNDNIRESELG